MNLSDKAVTKSLTLAQPTPSLIYAELLNCKKGTDAMKIVNRGILRDEERL